VYVQDSERRDVEHRLPQDLAVGGDDPYIGREAAKLFDGFGLTDRWRLEDREASLQRQRLDGRRRQLAATAHRAVRLRVDSNDLVPAFEQSAE
jgi:hypothetical protein